MLGMIDIIILLCTTENDLIFISFLPKFASLTVNLSSICAITAPLMSILVGKKEPESGKRRVKSARRAGKSVSFIDERSESDAPEVAAIDLVPKEEVVVKVVSFISNLKSIILLQKYLIILHCSNISKHSSLS